MAFLPSPHPRSRRYFPYFSGESVPRNVIGEVPHFHQEVIIQILSKNKLSTLYYIESQSHNEKKNKTDSLHYQIDAKKLLRGICDIRELTNQCSDDKKIGEKHSPKHIYHEECLMIGFLHRIPTVHFGDF